MIDDRLIGSGVVLDRGKTDASITYLFDSWKIIYPAGSTHSCCQTIHSGYGVTTAQESKRNLNPNQLRFEAKAVDFII